MYGIIGNPLAHSFSPQYFESKFKKLGIDEKYLRFQLDDIAELHDLLRRNRNLKGFNVTIPFKEVILPFMDSLDSPARKIGAVNCVAIQAGKLVGYNTDAIGFLDTLKPLLEQASQVPKNALILGTGGAAKAVAYVLDQLGIGYRRVSRTADDVGENLAYSDIPSVIADHTLVVNTTPVGTWPDVLSAPDIPYQLLSEKHILYDLIYNPSLTAFLQRGQENGATIKNGYDMLVAQAEASWSIWKVIH